MATARDPQGRFVETDDPPNAATELARGMEKAAIERGLIPDPATQPTSPRDLFAALMNEAFNPQQQGETDDD